MLIIEDDPKLGLQLTQHMEAAGLECRWIQDGGAFEDQDLDGIELVVLDLMLPQVHGFDLLKRIRLLSDAPVLILSARSETSDKIRGFRLGADDYLTKPFWPEELIERVRARLRRPIIQRGEGRQVGPLWFDKEQRVVKVEGQDVPLTRVEFDLLVALAERPGAAVTRRYLVDRVLDHDREGDERTLDVHISRLRKKLKVRALIKTVWGIGYRLNSEEIEP